MSERGFTFSRVRADRLLAATGKVVVLDYAGDFAQRFPEVAKLTNVDLHYVAGYPLWPKSPPPVLLVVYRAPRTLPVGALFDLLQVSQRVVCELGAEPERPSSSVQSRKSARLPGDAS